MLANRNLCRGGRVANKVTVNCYGGACWSWFEIYGEGFAVLCLLLKRLFLDRVSQVLRFFGGRFFLLLSLIVRTRILRLGLHLILILGSVSALGLIPVLGLRLGPAVLLLAIVF